MLPRSHVAPENFISKAEGICRILLTQPLRQWEQMQKSQIRAPFLKHPDWKQPPRAGTSSVVCALSGPGQSCCRVIRWKVQVKSGWDAWLSASPFPYLNDTLLIHQIRSLPSSPAASEGFFPPEMVEGIHPNGKEWTRSALLYVKMFLPFIPPSSLIKRMMGGEHSLFWVSVVLLNFGKVQKQDHRNHNSPFYRISQQEREGSRQHHFYPQAGLLGRRSLIW